MNKPWARAPEIRATKITMASVITKPMIASLKPIIFQAKQNIPPKSKTSPAIPPIRYIFILASWLFRIVVNLTGFKI